MGWEGVDADMKGVKLNAFYPQVTCCDIGLMALASIAQFAVLNMHCEEGMPKVLVF